ncbi:MAG: hypothetical protein QW614_01090 [Candidatus Caldarchaeum sp.]|uniref:Uncharacterized protein n=1 Tax=Caldiarchaeum subterraneum TaxID=311458 RepID=A0A7C5QN66_CALS0
MAYNPQPDESNPQAIRPVIRRLKYLSEVVVFVGFGQFLRQALLAKQVRLASVAFSMSFAALYVLAVGIVFQLPYELPPSFHTPSADVVFDGPFMQVPWLTIYLDKRWVLSINPEALISLSALTALVALNVAAISYVRRNMSCKIAGNIHLSWGAAVPAMFSFFSCCGSGLVFSLLMASGAGLSLLTVLQDYGRFFTFVSALLLAANLYLVYRKAGAALKLSQLVHQQNQADDGDD